MGRFMAVIVAAVVGGAAAVVALADDAPKAGEAAAEAATPAPAYADRPVQVTLADGTRGLRVMRLVRAPLADVWKAWATTEGLSKALSRPAVVEPRIGGKFEIQWVPDAPEGQRGSEGCVVQAWVPHRMLAFTWNAPPQFGSLRNEHSLVVIEMEEIAQDLVRVRLTHHGFGEGADWDAVYEYFTAAWPKVMDWVGGSLGGSLSGWREGGQQGWVYLITGLCREDFITTMTAEEREIMTAHSDYLRDKTVAGEVIQAGPCTDMKGPGIVMFYAPSAEAARALMENDPAVKHGIFTTELHPVALSLLRERDRAVP